jgi:hypothetical protein
MFTVYRRIGRDLTLEYKRDPEKLMNLIHQYEMQQKEKRKAQRKNLPIFPAQHDSNTPNSPSIQKKNSNSDDEDDEDDVDQVPELTVQSATTVISRMHRVLCRRATLRQEHDKDMLEVVNKWQARIAGMPSRRRPSIINTGDAVKITPLAVIERQDKWIRVLLGLRAIQEMKVIVGKVKAMKEEQRKRWFALRVLQRFVRKARRARRRCHLVRLGISDDDISTYHMSENEPSIRMLRRSMAGNEELHLYHKRVEAASLVIAFLKLCRKQYRCIMHCYFRYVISFFLHFWFFIHDKRFEIIFMYRKVLVIQRHCRRQLIANDGRYQLLSTYFDKLFPAFFAYLTMILSGKGNDLKNLTSLDSSRVRIHTRHLKQHPIVENFESPTFHAFIRENKTMFQQTSRYMGPSRNTLCTQMVNIERIKRHVLLSLLFNKRHQYSTRLESFKPVAIPAQTISRNDVLAFIRGERDPVVDYLQEVQRIEERHKAQYYAQKEASKHGRVYRKYTGRELCFCLLSSMTAEDFAMVVLNITEIAVLEYEKQTSPFQSIPSSANAGPRSSRKSASAMVGAPVPSPLAPSFGNNLSVERMFLHRVYADGGNRNGVGSRADNNHRGKLDRSDELDDHASNKPRSDKDDPDIKRMMLETARRVEAQALSQQRKEIIQISRRNSLLVRRSFVDGAAMMNQAMIAATSAVASGAETSTTNDGMAASASSSSSIRPGRRLSILGNAGANSPRSMMNLLPPHKPDEIRKSMYFKSSAAPSFESSFHKVGL